MYETETSKMRKFNPAISSRIELSAGVQQGPAGRCPSYAAYFLERNFLHHSTTVLLGSAYITALIIFLVN